MRLNKPATDAHANPIVAPKAADAIVIRLIAVHVAALPGSPAAWIARPAYDDGSSQSRSRLVR